MLKRDIGIGIRKRALLKECSIRSFHPLKNPFKDIKQRIPAPTNIGFHPQRLRYSRSSLISRISKSSEVSPRDPISLNSFRVLSETRIVVNLFFSGAAMLILHLPEPVRPHINLHYGRGVALLTIMRILFHLDSSREIDRLAPYNNNNEMLL